MVKCAFCKKETGYLPFHCKRCGNSFCNEHRLPENHNCTLEVKTNKAEKKLSEESIKNKEVVEKKVEEFISKPKIKLDDDSVLLNEPDFMLIRDKDSLVVDVYRDSNSPFLLPDQLPPIRFIRKIWDFIENSKEKKFNAILIKLLDNLSEYNLNLVPEEIKFLLDWAIESEKGSTEEMPYRINLTLSERKRFEEPVSITRDPDGTETYNYLFNPTNYHYKTIYNLGEHDVSANQNILSMYKGHISGLVILGALELPESLGNLSRLKLLSINEGAFKSLPHSFKNLTNLRYLYFYNTELEGFPEIITTFSKLRQLGLQGIKLDYLPEMVKKIAYKYHSRIYLKEGVNKDDANVLGLLEILAGESFVPWDEELVNSGIQFLPNYYQMNEEGKIISLSFCSPFGDLPLTYIPEELQKLDYLRELSIEPFYEDQIIIPESLHSFLKSIRFSRNE